MFNIEKYESALHVASHIVMHALLGGKEILEVGFRKNSGYLEIRDCNLVGDTIRGVMRFAAGPACERILGHNIYMESDPDIYDMTEVLEDRKKVGVCPKLVDTGELISKFIDKAELILRKYWSLIESVANNIINYLPKKGQIRGRKAATLFKLVQSELCKQAPTWVSFNGKYAIEEKGLFNPSDFEWFFRYLDIYVLKATGR